MSSPRGNRAPGDGEVSGRRIIDRRAWLRKTGLVAVGLAATPVPGWPRSWFRECETVIPFTDVPPGFTGLRSEGPEQFPGENLVAQDLRELRSRITPADEFFAVAHYGYPELDPAGYRLEIGGAVGRPLAFTLDELKERRRVERTLVFECSGNSRGLLHGMVGNATWAGTPLKPLLREALPTDEARHAHFWAADAGTEEHRGREFEQNFARAMSMDEVMETDPILAWGMNGHPLPVVHGFPLRLIVPGWYGVAQVKWLQRIELSPHRLMTRFMARDYVTLMAREVEGRKEWVETSVTRQRIKSVIARVTRCEDRFRVFGVAWSDGTPIDAIEVQVDGGPWEPASFQAGDPYEWTFFTYETTGLGPGEHTLVSRATDVRGRTQPEDLDLKVTRWENNELFFRTIEVS